MGLSLAASLAVASIASTVVGTGVAVYGQSQAAEAEAEAAKANARNAELTAQAREQESHEAILRRQRQARAELASMRATMAESGTVLNTGSNLDVLGAATTRLETNIADYARQSMLEARALRHNASLSTWEASQRQSAAGFQMAGTVLGGVARTAQTAYNTRNSWS